MTATITFSLPEEAVEHVWAVGAPLMAASIVDALCQTRSWLKHGHQFATVEEAINAVRMILEEVACVAEGSLA